MADYPKILIIGFVWPEPTSSAAGKRILQIIELFIETGWDVTFVSAAQKSDFSFNFNSFGIKNAEVVLNSDSFDDYVSNLNPSVVLFDRFMTEEQFGWRVASRCPEALRILDSEDLHCLRRLREKAVISNSKFLLSDLLDDETAKREVGSILRCDLSLIISEYEMDLLANLFKVDISLLHYFPILAQLQDVSLLPEFEDRSDFLFIGNFLHHPNSDAVQILSKLWPSINSEIPAAIMHIYGAYATSKILQLNSPQDQFFIHGRIKDATLAVKSARVILAPLRFGAGIKGKLLEAMQFGTPSITTSIGAEGLTESSLPWNGTITDDLHEFGKAAALLYTDKVLWQKSQQNGFEIIRKRHNELDFKDGIFDKIAHLQNNLREHRKANFIGSMLMHHSMRSTEFLSRWISEKNKNAISEFPPHSEQL